MGPLIEGYLAGRSISYAWVVFSGIKMKTGEWISLDCLLPPGCFSLVLCPRHGHRWTLLWFSPMSHQQFLLFLHRTICFLTIASSSASLSLEQNVRLLWDEGPGVRRPVLLSDQFLLQLPCLSINLELCSFFRNPLWFLPTCPSPALSPPRRRLPQTCSPFMSPRMTSSGSSSLPKISFLFLSGPIASVLSFSP